MGLKVEAMAGLLCWAPGWPRRLGSLPAPRAPPSCTPLPVATNGPGAAAPTSARCGRPVSDAVIAIKIVASLCVACGESAGCQPSPCQQGPRLFYCCRLAVFHDGLNTIKRHIPFEKQELPC